MESKPRPADCAPDVENGMWLLYIYFIAGSIIMYWMLSNINILVHDILVQVMFLAMGQLFGHVSHCGKVLHYTA